MENIIELVITIIFGFFWLFGNNLFNKNQEEQEPVQPTTQRRKKKRDRDSVSSDSEARQYEIREFIRRKIEEHRQQGEPRPVVTFEPEPQEEMREPLVVAKTAEAKTDEPFSGSSDEGAYTLEMQARLREIEATKRQAEALRSKVKQIVPESEDTDSGKSFEQEYRLSLRSVKSALKNPRSARAAFIYGEILGKPVSLQNPVQGRLEV